MDDPRVRHRLDGCGDVLTASLALEYEVMESGGGSVEGRHGGISIANKRRSTYGKSLYDDSAIRAH